MADEEQDKGSAKQKNPMVAILLVTNAMAMGFVAFLQYKAHLREANRPSIQDVVRAQMKEEGGGHGGAGAGAGHGAAEGGHEAPAEAEGEHKDQTDGILLPLAGFTANLAQGDGPRRYVRLDAVLKFSKDSKETEFKTRQPQIRDVIISILNAKRPEDLLKLEGKEYLKEEIKASINSFLVDGHVIDVYYVGFQIN